MPTITPRPPTLALLRSSAPLEAGDTLPDRIVLLPWGTTVTNQGTFHVNERSLAVFEANQRKIRRPTVKGDFNHESCRTDIPQPIKFAVSSALPRIVRGEGLIVENVRWTKAGREHCPDHYGDVSAAPYHDPDGTVIGLHSFAVCEHGEVNDMVIHPVPLSADACAAIALLSPPSPNLSSMDATTLLLKLLSAAGVTLNPEATAEQAAAAVAEAIEKLKAPETAPAELAAKPPMAELTALQASVTAMAGELATMKKQDGNNQIALLMAGATAAGKLVTLSAEDLTLLGPERTKTYLDALPAGTVPLTQRTPAQLAAGKSLTPSMPEDEAQALRDLGHDPATFNA